MRISTHNPSRRRARRLGTGLALASALLLPPLVASTTAATAQSLDAAGTHIVAFGDTRPIPSPPELVLQATTLKRRYCTGRREPARTVSLNAALSAARALVAADSSGRGLAIIASSSAGRNETIAIAAAAGALGQAKPAAALAALLRAHQLAPSDPVPLIDAAPLLSDAGKGDEALALLAAAQKLRLPRTDPFGIGWPALIDANRGQALIVTHQYASAEASLGAALRAAPLLTEADQNLAVAYDCQGNSAKTKHYLVAAVTRQEFPASDYINVIGDPPVGRLSPVETLDTSQGQQLTLETFKLPSSVLDGHAENQFFNSYDQQQAAKVSQLNQQFSSDQNALFAELGNESLATQQRTQEIEQAVSEASNEPDIASLQQAAQNADMTLQTAVRQKEGPSGCPDGGASHNQLTDDLAAADAAWRKYAGALYERQTALAANIADPLAHQVALDTADTWAQTNFVSLLADWKAVTDYDSLCDASTTPPNLEDAQTGQRNQPPSRPCPVGIQGVDLTLDLYFLQFKATCEKVSVEAAVGIPTLKGFIRIEKNFKDGSTTIYGGAKAGEKVGFGPLNAGATARGGAYVTYGSDGSVQDIGIRAGTSSAAQVGATGISVSDGEGTWGTAGLFN